ncbi:MBL fold metallo-hydrolase [Permianibacter sp. IMCC34836]|uniref:MBL fold metallo-hydrolase n=1 Tax=Permianibacter fluminis TaxID=2738515 RepID=UPI00155655C3|nr:MBL fold metallo-hydrolase [Permianibacter fluminis]NQD37582.1 MBL fold metallo-hydrolase [Permianibacter fluminis]
MILFLCVLAKASFAAGFTLHQLADGIYATERTEPAGLMFDANNVFIINEADVIVVDSNISPDSSKEVLAALRKLTNKPVRYVINTHWHEDHILGNSVWRDAYPGVEFIGHVQTHDDLTTTGASNRKSLLESGADGVASLREAIRSKVGLAGTPLTEEERISHESDIFLVERYLKEAGALPIIEPDIALDSELVLQRGQRRIDIRFLGAAHTRSDLVVWLPNEKILIAGDLLVWPIPLVGSTSYPAAYAETLKKLSALPATSIVPGHGPVFHDDHYLRQMIVLLDGLTAQVKAAKARGETLEQAAKSVDLSALRQPFVGDSILLKIIFNMYVKSSGIAAAYQEAAAPVK